MSSIDGIGAQSRYVPESWEPDEALAEHAATATETFEFTTAGAAVAALLIEHQDLARKQANEAYAAAEKQLEIQAEREYRERLEAADNAFFAALVSCGLRTVGAGFSFASTFAAGDAAERLDSFGNLVKEPAGLLGEGVFGRARDRAAARAERANDAGAQASMAANRLAKAMDNATSTIDQLQQQARSAVDAEQARANAVLANF
ncbi:MAG: hypothetical protein DIU78_000775 [Pseudomonadota bacterium]|nr:MAG: hypothetical protein DIU78_11735 [Pseudomonadota bacterium]